MNNQPLLYRKIRQVTPFSQRQTSAGLMVTEFAIPDGRVFIAPEECSSDTLAKHALSIWFGGVAEDWEIHRSGKGAPHAWSRGGQLGSISLSAAAGNRGALLRCSYECGFDLETIERIRLNITAEDDWLGQNERVLLRRLLPREQHLELACRWMLRESYGKAIGLGLPGASKLPFLRPHEERSEWTFGLYRYGNLLFADVCSGHDAMAKTDLFSARRPPVPVDPA